MLRLLIADDEEIIRNALSRMIDYPALGYELIASARNGMEAYDIICDESPDVVITDIKMPILDGIGLIERTKKSDPETEFILLSGYAEFEYAKKAMKNGVKQYLLKPTDKQELIDALTVIRQEKEELQYQQRVQQEEVLEKFLGIVRYDNEEHFLSEILAGKAFSEIYEKYKFALKLERENCCACICRPVKIRDVSLFSRRAYGILENMGAEMVFPLICTKEMAIMVVCMQTLPDKQKLAKKLEDGKTGIVRFLHAESCRSIWEIIVQRLSCTDRITLVGADGQKREYRNDIQSPWRLNSIGKLLVSSDGRKVDTLLDGVFSSPSMDNETARHIALELYLKAHSFDNEISVDAAADWFRKIYTCRDIQQVEEICRMFALRKNEHFGSSAQSNIAAIKAYVKAHYGDEELTLKWLAKNYLFCNEQYLSKQFVKEEKMRFSDYLNTVRMKKAKQLMALYRNDDIKDIAAEVGFENNPRYFSQVFKKYTGMTPSEYLAQLEV